MIGNSNGKNQPNAIKIEVTDLELDTKTTYNSMGEAARALNIKICRISSYFKQNQQKPYKNRYIFSGFAPNQK
jgi:hypothetical protein